MISVTKANRTGLYEKLCKLDILEYEPGIKKAGYILDPADGRFHPNQAQLDSRTPWVFSYRAPFMTRCEIFHKIFYNVFGHIHSFCRECYKVVVRPQTVEQLFGLYELQKELGKPSKCGIETRSTVCGLYGGYFYNRGKEEGLERHAEVKEMVDARLGANIPVILKRFCTEFELGQMPSDQVPDITSDLREWETFVEAFFPSTVPVTPQPEHLVAHVMKRWIGYAFQNGDLTYMKFTGGKKLTEDYVTYHPKEEHARSDNE